MQEIVISAIVLGLAAGLAPGPLMTLAISESLQRGKMAGIQVSLAPLITDAPILLFSYFLLEQGQSFPFFLCSVSVFGGLFVSYMAWKHLGFDEIKTLAKQAVSRPILTGVITNYLSPHPYLFWFTVGGPLLHQSLDISVAMLLMFLSIFYLLLVGFKMLFAILADYARNWFSSRGYRWLMQGLGVLLALMAMSLFWNAYQLGLDCSAN